MIVSAIRCNQCTNASEMEPGSGATIKMPDGWASVKPTVHISGCRLKDGKGKMFTKRRHKLKQLITGVHICPDCIDRLIGVGKIIKIADLRRDYDIRSET